MARNENYIQMMARDQQKKLINNCNISPCFTRITSNWIEDMKYNYIYIQKQLIQCQTNLITITAVAEIDGHKGYDPNNIIRNTEYNFI
ncbi:hypothetical protein RCL_jg4983.t1 [Rhizophagus clarus]|uniref:Uncharacterized protein n=1 Tax=Rhizophagus clarus TaxID=94130 RepID=A0A8H3QKE1_9GLOM|nr:hypothetical protein RCL_jg4983.t1 [Rhizophagus clarus]